MLTFSISGVRVRVPREYPAFDDRRAVATSHTAVKTVKDGVISDKPRFLRSWACADRHAAATVLAVIRP
jgi:hypothetical protein